MNEVVSINLTVDSNDVVHSKISCGNNKSFSDVLRGIELCIKELQEQINNKNKCPFSNVFR